jgi:hypothetical protein
LLIAEDGKCLLARRATIALFLSLSSCSSSDMFYCSLFGKVGLYCPSGRG